MTQIGYTILVVDSVQESLPFWTDGLGFKIDKPSDLAGYQTLVSSTGQTFALVEATVLEAHTGVAVTLPFVEVGNWSNGLFFSVEVDDLAKVLERLKPFEVHRLKAPSVMPWGATVACVQDPVSGLCFELMQKTHK
jgi:catechol 2,3-dioxygenase-like lactoylglutathione lyase family enzyme